MLWVNLLHIYQPPFQDKEVLKRISRESYERILDALENNPQAKITLNIQGCLTRQLVENGLPDIIKRIKNLAEKGQIELTGSAKFHPILPLIPEQEAVRQIDLNNKVNYEAFGDIYNPRGFFLPEMAYSKEAAKIIYDLGFKWIILDEISAKVQSSQPKADPPRAEKFKFQNNRKYFIKDVGLQVVFRDRKISNTYVPEEILKEANLKSEDRTIITATDGELYGHHHIDPEEIFESALKSPQIQTKTVSEYLDSLSEIEWIDPIPSSWESTENELKKNIPYALWNNPENSIHQKLWNIAKIATEAMENNQNDPNFYWAQTHLDRGLASCTFWWASAKVFNNFSAESWSPEEIGKGLFELVKAVRSLDSINNEKKIEIECLAAEVQKEVWQTHWRRIK